MITTNSKNILLADDSVFFRTNISAILIEAGHMVTFAKDGEEVIEKIKDGPDRIDLLLLDIQLPHIDGYGVLDWIRREGYGGRFPILMVTGVYDGGDMTEGLKSLSANGLLSKGFTPELVIHVINRILFRKKADNRAARRTPVSVPADFSSPGSTSTGFLLNISSGGLFLHTRLDLGPGSEVGLKFSLPGSMGVLDLEGTVRWATASSAAMSLFGGAGVMFKSVPEGDRKGIEGFVRKQESKLGLFK
jgi:uncharacterized protein (TIGR02266 family)